MDKTHRVRHRSTNFNGIAGSYRFHNSVSEPMTEREARRMATALSGTMFAIPTIEAPDDEEASAPTPPKKASESASVGSRKRAAGKRKSEKGV